MITVFLGPEAFWAALYFIAAWFAGRNLAPGYPMNDALSWLYWVAPPAAMAVSFALCFQWKIPGPLTWWLLVRLTLAAAAGVCVVTSVLAEKIEAGSGKPGVAMGMMVAIVLHLLATGCASVTGLVMLLRGGNAGSSLWMFVKQGAVVAALIAGFLLLAFFYYDRQTTGMSGEEKARRLSQAHGEKIGAKFPGEWREGRKNWTNFEIEFVAPNSIRLTSKVKYADQRRPSDVERHLAKWNGEVGAAFLEFIGARRPWRASWDGEHLVWSVEIGMKGLSRNQFLNDTAEAARLYVGPMSGWAGTDTWWLFGDAMEHAIEAGGDSRQRFALAWLEAALGHAAMYYERAGVHEERLGKLRQLQAEARRASDKTAMQRLLGDVRTAEQWRQVAHGDSDYAFLLNGSLRYVGLARSYAERSF